MKNPTSTFALIFFVAISLVTSVAHAQSIITTGEFANAYVDESGELKITPSKTSSQTDFDFLIGKWRLEHRKLKSRLTNCTEWEEFETSVEDFKILGGRGNMDVCTATFDGKPWEGRTLRLFDPETKLWSLYWMTSKTGTLEVPVVGSFEGNIGKFYCREKFKGKDVIVMFKWDRTDPNKTLWSQAFSPDNGKTWEWNWFNTDYRLED